MIYQETGIICGVPENLVMRADATRLGQIVRNLVLNAYRTTAHTN
jgi:signal transduction histidine kinase